MVEPSLPAAPEPVLSLLAVLEAMPAQVVVLAPDGTIRAVNTAWTRHAQSEVASRPLGVGTNYLTACETDNPTRESRRIAEGVRAVLVGTLREFSLDYGCATLSGPRYLQLLAAALPLGEQRGAVLLHLDVTDRHQAEDHLRRSEARLAEAQLLAQVGSWEWNPHTDAMWWSAQMYRLLGHEPGSVVPALPQLLAVVHEDDRAALSPALLAPRPQNQPVTLEFRVRRDAEVRWLRGLAHLDCDGAGQPQVVRGTLQDVTASLHAEQERLRLERRVLAAQKLESLGLLAGGVAHDFNNLLMAIIGNVALARQFPAESGNSLREIETASHRAADLCHQMLAFAGKGQTSIALVDLNVLVRETTQLLRGTIARAAQPVYDLGDNLPSLLADATQLRQVVMNLVINAADAMASEPGIVRLVTRRVTLTRELLDRIHEATPDSAPGEYLQLQVTDTGPGMPAEVKARIFEPFFTTKPTGRGLGLAAVQGIVRSHRGILTVESAVGQGSTFTVLLPIGAAAVPDYVV